MITGAVRALGRRWRWVVKKVNFGVYLGWSRSNHGERAPHVIIATSLEPCDRLYTDYPSTSRLLCIEMMPKRTYTLVSCVRCVR